MRILIPRDGSLPAETARALAAQLVQRLLEGSVADAVRRRVGAPVLVIHPAPDDLTHTAPAAAMTVAEQRLRVLLFDRV